MATLGATTVADLVAAPVDEVLKAQYAVSNTKGLSAFAPFVDGVSVPRAPIDAIRDGAANAVPILAGTNRDEWSLFSVFIGEPSVTPVKAALVNKVGEAAAARLLAAYEQQTDGVAKGWIDLIGDLAFRIPILRLAEANRAPAWVYRFDWKSQVVAGGALGAAHALELAFVWGQIEAPVAQFLIGGEVARAAPLGARMHEAWVHFITTGTCAWPRFEAPARVTKIFDVEDRVVEDPNGATRALWAELLATS
jgi:para-nitrobenzyl esterase